MSRCVPMVLTLTLLLGAPSPTNAQRRGFTSLFLGNGIVTTGAPRQVFSTNPFGLLTEFYNAEYEVRVAERVTAGAGASRRLWSALGERESPRLNGDVFVRYYPSGSAFNGIALGLKAGATRLPNERMRAGVGFDLNHSYAFTDHAVVSTGVGLKRLFGRGRADGSQSIVFTFRLNVGIGF